MNKNKLLKILTSTIIGGTLATVSVLPFVLTTNDNNNVATLNGATNSNVDIDTAVGQEFKTGDVGYTFLDGQGNEITNVVTTGDVYFMVTDETGNTGTVEVVGKESQNPNALSGVLNLPSKIEYNVGESTIIYTVTSIGENAFYGCSELTGELVIPNSVQSIGQAAFSECSLGFVDENNIWYSYVKNKETDARWLIKCNSSITSDVQLKNDTVGITSYAFYSDKNLTSVELFDGIKYIGYAAFLGSGLISIDIPDSVTSIGGRAFEGCANLSLISIGSGVKLISPYTFVDCSSLTSIVIPDSVTSIGTYAFGRSGLTSAIIPDSVQSIGYAAFCDCEHLELVTIPGSVKTIENSTFAECTSLVSVSLGYGIENIGQLCDTDDDQGSFQGCTSLTSITIPDSVKSIGYAAFAMTTALSTISIPNSVEDIDAAAFALSGLLSVIVPDSVTSIGEQAFAYCESLASFSWWMDDSSVYTLGSDAFTGTNSSLQFYSNNQLKLQTTLDANNAGKTTSSILVDTGTPQTSISWKKPADICDISLSNNQTEGLTYNVVATYSNESFDNLDNSNVEEGIFIVESNKLKYDGSVLYGDVDITIQVKCGSLNSYIDSQKIHLKYDGDTPTSPENNNLWYILGGALGGLLLLLVIALIIYFVNKKKNSSEKKNNS